MSDVYLADGDGVSFYLKISGRFPDMRWILTATNREPREGMADELSSLQAVRYDAQRGTSAKELRKR